ncbi:inosine-5'-monophosphate dehydrogenase [Teratosphaeria destructans]|uniref:Inosine-5'-monophosphate dehydrogenase n=1 Tax=Teratosphaeria destructans TaxID=418781 RepID=A0A9W7W268_9PEZI|nr:inosine-5'-monophosphate dehydrogenase [Teratosphaeria destructans]
MSSSMPIPKRKQPSRGHAATPSWSSSSAGSSYTSPSSSSSPAPMLSLSKGKFPAKAEERRRYSEEISPRRPSLLGSSLAKSEYTVVDLAPHDGPPRLVTCVKSSQGFDWNQELFLPSYVDYEQDLEHRQEPVQDIVLTDEEAAAILPQ